MLGTARGPLHIKGHVVFGGVVLVYFPDSASAGDRNTALKLAEPAAVDKLFSGPSLKVNAKELACHPVGTGQRLPD